MLMLAALVDTMVASGVARTMFKQLILKLKKGKKEMFNKQS